MILAFILWYFLVGFVIYYLIKGEVPLRLLIVISVFWGVYLPVVALISIVWAIYDFVRKMCKGQGKQN